LVGISTTNLAAHIRQIADIFLSARMIDCPVVMNNHKEKMKSLPYVLALATLATGCAGFEITADGGPEKEEKVEVTGSLIPRKQPKGIEVVGKEGFERAMDNANISNGMQR
jgi:hypothetical protein